MYDDPIAMTIHLRCAKCDKLVKDWTSEVARNKDNANEVIFTCVCHQEVHKRALSIPEMRSLSRAAHSGHRGNPTAEIVMFRHD